MLSRSKKLACSFRKDGLHEPSEERRMADEIIVPNLAILVVHSLV